MIGHLILYIGVIFSRNVTFTIVIMFLNGVCASGRASVGYLYMIELTPKKYHAYVGTVLSILNCLTTVFGCIYFRYISKHWIWLVLVGFTFNFLCVIFMFFIPESPKYLIARKRFDEARKSIYYIAKFNKKEI